MRPVDVRPLDQAGMSFSSIEELRRLEITDAEVVELAQARQSGLSEDACLELLRLARNRKEPFTSGGTIAGLLKAGLSEPSVLELAHLNQLGPWAGEAQILRLTGLSDRVVLAVARRRAAGLVVPSGASLSKLKNAGMSEQRILEVIAQGTSDAQVQAMLAAHEQASRTRGFVRQRGRRRY